MMLRGKINEMKQLLTADYRGNVRGRTAFGMYRTMILGTFVLIFAFLYLSTLSVRAEEIKVPEPYNAGYKKVTPAQIRELENRTIDIVNEYRVSKGLSKLKSAKRLRKLAREKSNDMAKKMYMDHTSPDGVTFQQRARKGGILVRGYVCSENVAYNHGFRDPVKQAFKDWINSPPHRGAILTEKYEYTGVGIGIAKNGTFYFTQLFFGKK